MSQKAEPILNLALETPEELRRKTQELNVGYLENGRAWELIVKHSKGLEELAGLGIKVEELIAGYAVLTVPEDLVESVLKRPEIEYAEKPKSFYYSDMTPVEDPCIATVLAEPPYLGGEGVLVAVLDSGVDFRRREFRNEDGTTRIRSYISFDASGMREYGEEDLNEALLGRKELPFFPNTDHGTAVAGVAAGFAPASESSFGRTYRGVAYKSDLLVIRLGEDASGFLQTTNLMRGVTYALRKAREWNQPLVINLSFGNTYGSHRGDSLLERFLDNASEIGRTVICAGSGNEGVGLGHFSRKEEGDYTASFAIADYETAMSLQVWQPFSGNGSLLVEAPDGGKVALTRRIFGGIYQAELGEATLLVYYGEPSPYSVLQEIYMEWIPKKEYILSGVWSVSGKGPCDMYLHSGVLRAGSTRFLAPDSAGTLTIPSTAGKVITVGAYNPQYDAYAEFSGRGNFMDGKPDIAAPGQDVLAPWGQDGYLAVTGTSFATPIVSGMAAILMERGIVLGEDPYMYGEKVKAYLRAGARSLRGDAARPNEKTGWGAACLSASMELW